MGLDNITLDEVKVKGREEAPIQEATQETAKTEMPTTPPTVESTTKETPVEESKVAASFDWKEKTGGKYEDFDTFWNDFQELESKEPEVKEVEKPVDFKDDYIAKAVAYYEENGDLTPFLEATKFKYDDMSDEQVLRKNLRDKYKGLGEKAFDKKFQRYMEDNFDPDEDEGVRGELMRYEAKKVREELKAKQQEFLNIEPKSKTKAPEVDQQAELEKWKGIVEADESVKSLRDNKGVTIKYGEEEFTFELKNPDNIVEQVIDSNKFWGNFSTERNGEPAVDIARFNKVAAYANDPESFEKRLIEFGKSLGKGDVIDELENPTQIKTPRRESSDPSPSGSWKDDFFAELKKQK